MTDPTAPSSAPLPPSSPKSPKPKRPRRTWKQRLKILVLVLLIGACLLRIALNVLLPTVIDKVAGLFGLDVGYQRLSLSILGGTAHVWGLEVRPKEGGDRIATCDYIEGNLAPLELLRGRLVVYRAEVDGVTLTLERAADGSIPLLQKFMAAQSQSAVPVVQTKASAAATPMSLDAPLRVDAVRLSHVTATLRDRSVTPAFEAVVRTSVRVSDVGLNGSPAKFELEVGVDPLLDTLRVSGEAHTSPTSLRADVQLVLRGLHPKAAAGYLRPLGLRPIADGVTVQANASITADTIPNSADFKAMLAVDHVTAVADGQQWASLGTLTLDAKRAGPGGLELGTLALADGSASARRTAEGRVQIAGLELAPVEAAASIPPPATRPALSAASPAASPPTPSAASPVAVAGGSPFHFSLDIFELKRLQANFTDDAVRPAAAFVARLDSLTGGFPDAVGGSRIDSAATRPVGFDLQAALPGLVDSIKVNGSVGLFGPQHTVGLTLRSDGIRPELLRPYLERVGVTSLLKSGSLTTQLQASIQANADGGLAADASLGGLSFSDDKASLFDINSANVAGFSYTPATGAIGVRSVALSGPALSIIREADGHVRSAGFAFMAPAAVSHAKPGEAGPPSAAPPTPDGSGTAPAAQLTLTLPRIEIGQFSWTGLQLTLEDRAAASPTKLVISDAGVQLADLLIDLRATQAQKPGTFRAWLNAPGLARDLSATGTLTPSPGRFAVDAVVNGQGLSGAPVAPYVQALGIEPTLADGRIHATAAAVLTQGDGPPAVDFDLADVTYADGETELAGVDSLHLSGLSPTARRIDIGELQLRRPRVRIARDADGALRAGGVRYRAPAATTRPAAAQPREAIAQATTGPATQSLAGGGVGAARSNASTLLLKPLPIEVGLKTLRIEDAAVDWSDAAAPAGPTQVHFVGGLSLDGFDVSPSAKPATLRAMAAVNGALENATIVGTVIPSPLAPAIDLAITADGLAAGPLAAYLPPTIQSSLRDGHFEAHVVAGASNHDAGGLVANFAVDGLRLSDTNDLLTIDTFTLAADRIDPAGGVFTINELTASGVALDVRQSAAGTLESAGLRLVNAPASKGPAATRSAAATAVVMPAEASVAVPAAEPVASLASLVGDARRPLPSVLIQKLDFGLRRLRLAGFTGPDAAPLDLNNTRLYAPAPIALGGRRTDVDAPVTLKLTGGLAPVVRAFDIALVLKAMANEPSIAINFTANGIRGGGLLAVLPALKEKIDGSDLTDGELAAQVDATVNYGRRGPRDFDLARGFTAEFNVKPLTFRAAPGGPVLAGLQAVHGEGIKVEPATGNVTVKTLDVTTPTFRAHRDAAGLHAVGLTLRLGAQEPVETLAPPSQAAPVVAPAVATDVAPPAVPPVPAPAVRPANEIRLDHFTVSGIDAVLEDRTAEPTTVIPLRSLDLDLRDLSNQLPWSGRSTRFSLLVTSDKVPLPPRRGISGQATTQSAAGQYTEQRELFAQVTADGKIGFARTGDRVALDGWTKTAVNGFELLGVRGLAKPYGVTIGGGAFDDTNDIRFRPDGNIETRNKIVFTNLSLSEAANGPLKRLLKLPAPIDVAIGAVTDSDGSITLNLPVPIKNGAVTAGDVAGPALGAVTNVLVTGIASAPLKAIGGVGDLLGLSAKDEKPEAPVVIGFLPAYDGLDDDARSAVAELSKQLKDDDTLELQLRHTLTDSDVARTGRRVNPPPQQAMALAAQVRQQKTDLLLRHDTLAAQARGDLGAAATDRGRASLAALREVSEQIARADTALDDLYALTGPSAALQADRRMRSASLDLARRRLDALRSAMTAAGVKNVDARVHATNPQFDPTPDPAGGTVTVTLIRKKH